MHLIFSFNSTSLYETVTYILNLSYSDRVRQTYGLAMEGYTPPILQPQAFFAGPLWDSDTRERKGYSYVLI